MKIFIIFGNKLHSTLWETIVSRVALILKCVCNVYVLCGSGSKGATGRIPAKVSAWLILSQSGFRFGFIDMVFSFGMRMQHTKHARLLQNPLTNCEALPILLENQLFSLIKYQLVIFAATRETNWYWCSGCSCRDRSCWGDIHSRTHIDRFHIKQ